MGARRLARLCTSPSHLSLSSTAGTLWPLPSVVRRARDWSGSLLWWHCQWFRVPNFQGRVLYPKAWCIVLLQATRCQSSSCNSTKRLLVRCSRAEKSQKKISTCKWPVCVDFHLLIRSLFSWSPGQKSPWIGRSQSFLRRLDLLCEQAWNSRAWCHDGWCSGHVGRREQREAGAWSLLLLSRSSAFSQGWSGTIHHLGNTWSITNWSC